MSGRLSPSSLLKRAEVLAHEKFGFEALSSGQRDALCSLFSGHDTLAILATGAGKSAIYQLSGLVRGGLTLVVSPLVALQHDQVEHLRSLGIEAHLLNSSLSATEREAVWDSVTHAETAFLLLAPEQLGSHDTLERLQATKPNLFVVDEAHCVSSWGHDFRPDFARLGKVIESLNSPPVLALTATAAPPVRSDILERLAMKKAQVVVAGFDRPNLWLEVRHFVRCNEKQPALLDAVAEGPKPAIVYCATRRETEEVAQELEKRGLKALAYHAGLAKTERDARQNAFMNDEADAFVATIAFGMGVDKPNVRRVYHFDVSESLDSYFQEAGRAGRDGEPAEAILFFCSDDLGLRRFQIGAGESAIQTAMQLAATLRDMDATSIKDVESELDISRSALRRVLLQLEEAQFLVVNGDGDIEFAPDESLKSLKRTLKLQTKRAHEWDTSRLEMMRQYAETDDCRRQLLLAYFGQDLREPCGHCDNCRQQNSGRTTEPHVSSVGNWPTGGHVHHKQWGQGEIIREDEDTLIIMFASVGYKTLARQLVTENNLLELVA